MRRHYTTKVIILTLGTAIPVLTTINAWSWTIAIASALIAVLEGIAQLWKFHDRFVAARMLQKGLEKERILYEGRAGGYVIDDERGRDSMLVESISRLLKTYDSQVISALKGSTTNDVTGREGDGSSAPIELGRKHRVRRRSGSAFSGQATRGVSR